MAQLSSPGVSVTVVDESFYTPGAPGTVPLIIVASEANKQNAAGTGVAKGTLPANAGIPYLLTSQAELGATFGVPYFETDASNNPVNAGELNEYGLQAAYSFLGVSNRAYVVRANLDTAQLKGEAIAPVGAPEDGTLWFDTADTNFGLFEWNANAATTTGGQTFTHKSVTVITDAAMCILGHAVNGPLTSFGSLGDYAAVAVETLVQIWFKKPTTSTPAGAWVVVGSPEWSASHPTATSGSTASAYSEGNDTIKINGINVTTSGTTQASMADAINGTGSVTALGISAYSSSNVLYLYSDGTNAIEIGSGNGLTNSGLAERTYYAPELQISAHTNIPMFGVFDDNKPTGSVWIKATAVNAGAHWFVKQYFADTGSWVNLPVKLYPNSQTALANLDPTGGGYNLPKGTLYVKYDEFEDYDPVLANFVIHERTGSGATSVKTVIIGNNTFNSNDHSGENTFVISESEIGTGNLVDTTVTFTAIGIALDDATALVNAITAAAAVTTLVSAEINSDNSVTIKHTQGGEIYFTDGQNNPFSSMFPVATTNLYMSFNPTYDAVASLWSYVDMAVATAGSTPPTTIPADQTLWYNTDIAEVDIMIHNGSDWIGYGNANGNVIPSMGGDPTDPMGPIVGATKPKTQSDGSPLANGDIWVSTADLENFPHVYVYALDTKKWVLRDNADHTSGNGIVFHDARWSGAGDDIVPDSIQALLSYDFLDFDAPDPALFPRGTLLWNLRRSGFNVKKYVQNYVDTTEYNVRNSNEPMTGYYPNRWVSDAANDLQGVGQFGRKAQRAVVLQAIEALIQSNQKIRQPDTIIFNLLACPGYLETASSLIGLNNDNGLSAFIIHDTPARLTPDATSLNNWGNNVAGAAVDGDVGLIMTDPYSAIYYPWGYTTDLLGNNIVVPPSHIMLRTIALSDNVSYPWFAPAGVRRGGVTNASSVGYVDGQTGEFITVALNVGQRDTLAHSHINPITYLAGTGLIAYGQKTRQLVASSLDRINVARLVIYLRYQLNVIAKPFIFEPNDTITRNEIKQQIEKLMLDLTGQRALYDYIVVCDNSNNTPSRIDANELHVDIAIEPVKAVEFIYIPLRLENTGAIKGLGAK